jgi:hypothetical protein
LREARVNLVENCDRKTRRSKTGLVATGSKIMGISEANTALPIESSAEHVRDLQAKPNYIAGFRTL